MKAWQVDKHLDTSCPGSPQPQSPAATASRNTNKHQALHPSPNRTKAPERLPSLAYGMIKDGPLRKKMAELGIPNHGTRQALEKRHREWVTIWNANCDSARPKKRSELLNDLDVWERTIGSRAPVSSKAAAVGAQIKDKDFDGAAWAARHDDSFKDLIANARKTRMQAQEKVKESSQSEINETKKRQEEPQLSPEPQPTSSVDPRLSNQPQANSEKSQKNIQPAAPPEIISQPMNSSQSSPFSYSNSAQTSSQQYAVPPPYSNNPTYQQNPYQSPGIDQTYYPYQSQPPQSQALYQSLPHQPAREPTRTSSSQPAAIPSASSPYNSQHPFAQDQKSM